jgi:hypothetical protein
MKRERERIEPMWNGCSEMRERGRERNGEKDERDMEEEGKSRKKKVWAIQIKMLFFGNVVFMFFYYVIRNLKALRANKAFTKTFLNK